ncbi:nidogen-like domain-containing protein [Roseisolibacter sp. H3M3-2]|uniref:nidogen-like domain-containing protein n=1 Tax=Roseisolibacter sp. H3M3-2 TaxID=3031323 RepID=UPI0023DA841B|nr:nidogen-like domain-containing protein [Roseisolibacter sp. H3M3-2]MDF1502879.1 PEP-CTERM sorting domain-containing protein [Roseisolibacter sp. H3M3-2]
MSARTLAAALLAAALAAPAAQAQIRDVAGFATTSLGRTDDGTTGPVDVGFAYNFFGLTGSSLYVSNNGFVSFSTPPSFTPQALAANKIIAAFWADVDTEGGASGITSYGTGAVDVAGIGTRNAFFVNWPGVGYYNNGTDRLNTFQIFLVDRNDRGVGDFDFELNYGSMQWEAGSHSNDGGSGGLGNNAEGDKCARAGYSNGMGTVVELAGSGVCGALIDGGANALAGQRFAYSARSGVVAEVPSATVPEPSTYALMGTGLLGLAGIARRRRSA